ncbi:putative ABC transporter ATP-binding protein [uncultured archaeon]|nr:putative ABC transporter ATP-binding protein [uncultured archaeon]
MKLKDPNAKEAKKPMAMANGAGGGGKPVLEIREAWKIYRVDKIEVPAVKGISMKIMEGEFVAVIGASGSGKSTTMNLMGALDSPSTGHVLLDGIDLAKLSEPELARIRGKKIGFVFQQFNLHPTLSVFENIALPMRIHELPDVEIPATVSKLIDRVGLRHRQGHLPSQLSGGEKQRVAVARALSTNPSMVLADEPTGNLDTKTSHEIMMLFNDLNRKEGKTVIVVTHEHDIANYARRVITLKDGEIISDTKQGGVS